MFEQISARIDQPPRAHPPEEPPQQGVSEDSGAVFTLDQPERGDSGQGEPGQKGAVPGNEGKGAATVGPASRRPGSSDPDVPNGQDPAVKHAEGSGAKKPVKEHGQGAGKGAEKGAESHLRAHPSHDAALPAASDEIAATVAAFVMAAPVPAPLHATPGAANPAGPATSAGKEEGMSAVPAGASAKAGAATPAIGLLAQAAVLPASARSADPAPVQHGAQQEGPARKGAQHGSGEKHALSPAEAEIPENAARLSRQVVSFSTTSSSIAASPAALAGPAQAPHIQPVPQAAAGIVPMPDGTEADSKAHPITGASSEHGAPRGVGSAPSVGAAPNMPRASANAASGAANGQGAGAMHPGPGTPPPGGASQGSELYGDGGAQGDFGGNAATDPAIDASARLADGSNAPGLHQLADGQRARHARRRTAEAVPPAAPNGPHPAAAHGGRPAAKPGFPGGAHRPGAGRTFPRAAPPDAPPRGRLSAATAGKKAAPAALPGADGISPVSGKADAAFLQPWQMDPAAAQDQLASALPDGISHSGGSRTIQAVQQAHHAIPSHAPERVTLQIARAAGMLQDGPIELRLDPEELGAVRMHMHLRDNGTMVLNIMAERPDTLDLMRRHAEQLGAQMRDAGFDALDIAFSSHDGGQPGAFGDQPAPPGTAPPAADGHTPQEHAREAGPRRRPDPEGRIDLRM